MQGKPKGVGGMFQGITGPQLRNLARREHAAALEDYCASLASIEHALDDCVSPTPEQLERAQAAKLRLENARTLLQLSISVAIDGIAVAHLRRRERLH
jgi:hypothetical protein